MVIQLNAGQFLESLKSEVCISLEISLLNLSLRYKFLQERNMIFSTINDKNLKYLFQMCRPYKSQVVDMYAGIDIASSSQPTTKAK